MAGLPGITKSNESDPQFHEPAISGEDWSNQIAGIGILSKAFGACQPWLPSSNTRGPRDCLAVVSCIEPLGVGSPKLLQPDPTEKMINSWALRHRGAAI